jgi:hypothetical protein
LYVCHADHTLSCKFQGLALLDGYLADGWDGLVAAGSMLGLDGVALVDIGNLLKFGLLFQGQ